MGLIGHPTNPLSETVIGAAVEVHRQLGPGLLESSYHGCLCRELELRAIPYQSQVALPMEYKGSQIAKGYVIDLLIEDSLIVEIKSVDKLLPIHSAQLMTYLRLQHLSAGLLINFNVHTPITRSQANPALIPQSVRPPCTPCLRGKSVAVNQLW